MSQPSTTLTARSAAAIAAALSLSAVPGLAQAQQQQRQSPPTPAPAPLFSVSVGATRYSTPDGAVRFVFDRSVGRVALVRFEGDPEVHVLRPIMAAGGGEIYRTEDGSVMLRVTPQGGVTVYTRALRTGAPASEVSAVAPLTPEALAFADMQNRFRELQAELRSRRSVGRTVTFTVPARMSAATAGVVVDAAERVAEGLSAAPLTNVRQVIIRVGPSPAAVLNGDTLLVQVVPEMGYAGRPSSITVRNVVTGAVQGPRQ